VYPPKAKPKGRAGFVPKKKVDVKAHIRKYPTVTPPAANISGLPMMAPNELGRDEMSPQFSYDKKGFHSGCTIDPVSYKKIKGPK